MGVGAFLGFWPAFAPVASWKAFGSVSTAPFTTEVRPAGRLRLDAREARLDEIEAIDEGVDEADGVVGADVIVHSFRRKKKLVAFEAGNVRHARF